jgi:hypothetical protein
MQVHYKSAEKYVGDDALDLLASSPHQLNSELAVIGIDNGKNLSAGLVRRQTMKCWSLKMCQSLVTGACATAPSA